MSFTGSTTEAENGSIIFNPLGDLFDSAFVFNPVTFNGPTWTVSTACIYVEIAMKSQQEPVTNYFFVKTYTLKASVHVTAARVVIEEDAH